MTADELKALRAAAGLTQRELAERLDVHTLTVARYEQGIRSISGPVAKLVVLVCVPTKKGKYQKGDGHGRAAD